FVFSASPGNAALPFVNVHVPRLAADKGFVYLDFACQLSAILALKQKPDSVHHEPCSLLGDTKSAVNLPRANAVLAVSDQPHCGKPLIETERRILEDGSHLHRELPPFMPIAALPAPLVFEESDSGAPTDRTYNAVRPAFRHNVTQAIVGVCEVNDCFLEGLDFGFHDVLIIEQSCVLSKYIIALIWLRRTEFAVSDGATILFCSAGPALVMSCSVSAGATEYYVIRGELP